MSFHEMKKKFNCASNTSFSEILFFLAEVTFKYLIIVMLFAICYPLYNLWNLKNTHGRVLLLVKLQASAYSFTKKKYSSIGVIHVVRIVQMVPNRAKRLKYRD